MIHELKTWPKHFDLIAKGQKPFELRKNDRGFKVADILMLQRFDPEKGVYTGAEIQAVVLSVLENFTGIESGYCIIGIQVLKLNRNIIALDI